MYTDVENPLTSWKKQSEILDFYSILGRFQKKIIFYLIIFKEQSSCYKLVFFSFSFLISPLSGGTGENGTREQFTKIWEKLFSAQFSVATDKKFNWSRTLVDKFHRLT